MEEHMLLEAFGLLSFAEKAIEHTYGGTAHHLIAKGTEKLIERIRNIGADKKLPANHDLLKAVRTAMLNATLYMAYDLADEMHLASVDNRQEDAARDFKSRLVKWVKKEIKNVYETIDHGHFSTEAYSKVELLLATAKKDSDAKPFADLGAVTTQQWIQEIQNGLAEDLPELAVTYLKDGWAIGDKKMNWFTLSCFWFGQLLKDKKYEAAKDAFQNRLISEIATGVGAANLKLDTVLANLETISANASYLLERWADITRQLDAIEAKVNIIIGKQDIAISKQDVTIEVLLKIEQRLASLEAQQQAIPSVELLQKIQTLTAEKNELRQLLLQKDDIIAQQETTRKALEQSLAAEQGKEELKKLALVAVEEKDYDKAETLLKESAKKRMEKVAEDFYQLGNIKEMKLEYVEALKYYELAAKIPPHNTEYLRKAAGLCRTFGLLETAIQYIEQTLSIDLQQLGEEDEDVATDFNELALIWKDKGNLDKAIEYFGKALQIYHKLLYDENTSVAIIYNNLGLTWKDKGNFDKAIEYLEKALQTHLKLNGEEDPHVATNYGNLGTVWQDKGYLDKAIEYLEKALNIHLKLFGEENANTAIDYNNLGIAWLDKGNPDKTIEYLEKALQIDLKLYGEENPQIANLYNNFGLAWYAKRSFDKAIEYFERALGIDLKIHGEDNPKVATRYNNLGTAWQDKSNFDKAIEYLEKALRIDLKLYGEENPQVATRYNNLGTAWQDKGNPDKAIEYYEKVLNINLKLCIDETPNTAITNINLGMAWQAIGDLDKAIAYGQKSYSILLKLYGADHPNTKMVKENLDGYLSEKGI